MGLGRCEQVRLPLPEEQPFETGQTCSPSLVNSPVFSDNTANLLSTTSIQAACGRE